jgi:hypothetical protein
MDLEQVILTVMAMPIVSFTAFAFGRNPFIWAFWAYLFQFWCLIPLFLMKKKPRQELPQSTLKLAGEINIKRELRKIKTPDDLFGQGKIE